MTVPEFLHDKTVQGAIFVFVLGSVFVMLQIKVARQQLFVSLADKRHRWYEDFKSATGARIQEINKVSRDPQLMLQMSEALQRFWRLRSEAVWLFGSEIDKSAEKIENILKDLLDIQVSFYEAKARDEAGSAAKFQMEWMANHNQQTQLESLMRYDINPYLYVGDVRRGWRWSRAAKASLLRSWYAVEGVGRRVVRRLRK